MTKSIIILFSLIMFLLNCSIPKTENNLDKSDPSDYYKSIQLKKINPGQGIGILKIEETRCKDIFDEKYSAAFYNKNGIELQFRNGDTLTGIILQNEGNYYRSNNKIRLTEKEILETFGKPKNKNLQINKGHVNIGEMQSLNYQGFSIIFIDSTKSVISIFKNEP